MREGNGRIEQSEHDGGEPFVRANSLGTQGMCRVSPTSSRSDRPMLRSGYAAAETAVGARGRGRPRVSHCRRAGRICAARTRSSRASAWTTAGVRESARHGWWRTTATATTAASVTAVTDQGASPTEERATPSLTAEPATTAMSDQNMSASIATPRVGRGVSRARGRATAPASLQALLCGQGIVRSARKPCWCCRDETWRRHGGPRASLGSTPVLWITRSGGEG